MVNPGLRSADGPRALQSAGAFIHHLPVDQAFTLEAGTTIWGYPKVMADFTIREGRQFGFDCSVDGQLVIGMEFRRGLPIRLTPRQQAQRSYSHRDGGNARPPSNTRWTVCGPDLVECASGWASIPMRKSWHRWVFRSARCCPALLSRFKMTSAMRRRSHDSDFNDQAHCGSN